MVDISALVQQVALLPDWSGVRQTPLTIISLLRKNKLTGFV